MDVLQGPVTAGLGAEGESVARILPTQDGHDVHEQQDPRAFTPVTLVVQVVEVGPRPPNTLADTVDEPHLNDCFVRPSRDRQCPRTRRCRPLQ